jgi:uncharacterized membrane protein YuzA (DUF378 family)
MQELNSLDWAAIILVTVGAINWGLVGILGVDLVKFMFGDISMVARVVYTLVGISGLYLTSIVKGLQKK